MAANMLLQIVPRASAANALVSPLPAAINPNNLGPGFFTTTTDANTDPPPAVSDPGPPFHPLQRIMYMIVR